MTPVLRGAPGFVYDLGPMEPSGGHGRPSSRDAGVAGTGIEVRRATNADAASIAHIASTAGSDVQRRAYSPKEAAAGGALFGDLTRLVACIAGQVVGTVQFCRREGVVELLRLEVHEDHRGQGVARALVERLATEARAAGAEKITLQTVREMGYEQLLERLGFRTVSSSPLSLIDSEGTETLTEITLERPLGS